MNGTDARLAFTTLAAKDFAPGAAALRIEIDARPDALSVTVTELGDDGAVQGEHIRVLPSLARPELAYWNSETRDWQPDWRNQPGLPRLVRISGLTEGGATLVRPAF